MFGWKVSMYESLKRGEIGDEPIVVAGVRRPVGIVDVRLAVTF